MFTILLIDVLTVLALPFLWIVGLFRPQSDPPKKILVIQLGKIGDMVATTPLLRSLHEAFPTAKITVLCISRVQGVLSGNPAVHRVITSDTRGVIRCLRLLFRVLWERFDISMAVLPGTFTAVLGVWAAAPVRLHTYGARTGALGEFLSNFHTHRALYGRGTRTFDHYMFIAQTLGAKPVPYEHQFFLSDSEKQEAAAWLHAHALAGERFAIVSLTAGNVLKEWPADRFVAVAQYLALHHHLRIVFSSADKTRTHDAAKQVQGSIDAGGLNLRLLSAIIERAALFVSVDTGPLYIAHALGVPLIDIVGPVDPNEQPPKPGPKVQLVMPSSEVKPTSFVAETLRVSSAEQRAALELTTVKDVTEAIDGLLHA